MKKIFLKNTVAAVSLLLAMGYVETASAHDQLGSLGYALGATDLYIITCSDDGSGPAAKLQTSVTVTPNTTANGVKVSARTVSIRPPATFKATNATDLNNTDLVPSLVATTLGTDGDFYVSVGKSNRGAAYYQLDFHCLTSGNAHTGTAISMKQNQ